MIPDLLPQGTAITFPSWYSHKMASEPFESPQAEGVAAVAYFSEPSTARSHSCNKKLGVTELPSTNAQQHYMVNFDTTNYFRQEA